MTVEIPSPGLTAKFASLVQQQEWSSFFVLDNARKTGVLSKQVANNVHLAAGDC